MWALTAPLLLQLERIPPLQLLSITSGVAFLLTTFNLTIKKKWSSVRQSSTVWTYGVGFFALSEITYMLSFQMAPAAHVDLINYLWPLFVGLFSAFLPKGKFSRLQFLATCLGLIGVSVLILDRPDFLELPSKAYLGYGLAFCSALGWGLYAIFSKYYHEIPTSMIGLYCGATSLISICSHLLFEETISPTWRETWILLFIGLAISGLSYLMWDYSVKKGNITLLSLSAYFTPIATVCFLILCGKASLTINLAISSCLIVFATICLSITEWRKILPLKWSNRWKVVPVPVVDSSSPEPTTEVIY